MSSATSSLSMMTIPVYRGTFWRLTKSSPLTSDYHFRLISYFDGEGTYFQLHIKTLEKSRLCAEFLIKNQAKLYCPYPQIITYVADELKANISLLFPSSSSLNTFVNYSEVTGLLEKAGLVPAEQQDDEQKETAQITYVHKATKENSSDPIEFYKAVNKIREVFKSFTEKKTARCDTNSLVEFRLDREDCIERGISTIDGPSPSLIDPVK